MADTEDPIATLREHEDEIAYALRHAPFDFRRLLSALASSLAERERRIAYLEAGLRAVIEERYEYASGEGAFRQAIARATLEGTRL